MKLYSKKYLAMLLAGVMVTSMPVAAFAGENTDNDLNNPQSQEKTVENNNNNTSEENKDKEDKDEKELEDKKKTQKMMLMV
ncbi:hypothetical protein [Peptoniphilus sp.]|jgi:hypothetical protein|uniref:hypothetical protein n=1 Tax=Peptoniphilus sp. TaxID=1971214 RepID=UPI003D8E2B7D